MYIGISRGQVFTGTGVMVRGLRILLFADEVFFFFSLRGGIKRGNDLCCQIVRLVFKSR